MIPFCLSASRLLTFPFLPSPFRSEIGVKLSASGETGDVIKGQGTVQYYKDLGIDGDEDMCPLILAWKLRGKGVM